MNYFLYTKKETDYLSLKDSELAAAISSIGHIYRPIDSNLFTAITHQIIAQQISNKALSTIWEKVNTALKNITPDAVLNAGISGLRSLGVSNQKASYITGIARRFIDGTFYAPAIQSATDEKAIELLTDLKGIGVWSAQMILLFSLQRPNILSRDDLAIKRGLCLLHNLQSIDDNTFQKYYNLYSPYCSTASLYLWEIAARKTSVKKHQ